MKKKKDQADKVFWRVLVRSTGPPDSYAPGFRRASITVGLKDPDRKGSTGGVYNVLTEDFTRCLCDTWVANARYCGTCGTDMTTGLMPIRSRIATQSITTMASHAIDALLAFGQRKLNLK